MISWGRNFDGTNSYVQGIPKKGDLRLTSYKTTCKCTRDKDRVSLRNLRKPSFKYSTRTSTFWEKMAEKNEVEVARKYLLSDF